MCFSSFLELNHISLVQEMKGHYEREGGRLPRQEWGAVFTWQSHGHWRQTFPTSHFGLCSTPACIWRTVWLGGMAHWVSARPALQKPCKSPVTQLYIFKTVLGIFELRHQKGPLAMFTFAKESPRGRIVSYHYHWPYEKCRNFTVSKQNVPSASALSPQHRRVSLLPISFWTF